jgi:hypothetical protein
MPCAQQTYSLFVRNMLSYISAPRVKTRFSSAHKADSSPASPLLQLGVMANWLGAIADATKCMYIVDQSSSSAFYRPSGYSGYSGERSRKKRNQVRTSDMKASQPHHGNTRVDFRSRDCGGIRKRFRVSSGIVVLFHDFHSCPRKSPIFHDSILSTLPFAGSPQQSLRAPSLFQLIHREQLNRIQLDQNQPG